MLQPTQMQRPSTSSAMPPAAPVPSEDEGVAAPGSANVHGAVGDTPGIFCYMSRLFLMVLFQVCMVVRCPGVWSTIGHHLPGSRACPLDGTFAWSPVD